MFKHLLLIICLLPSLALAQPANSPTLLVTGDSLSAAYGMALDRGWVVLLQRRLTEQGYPHKVVNTSVSGETTAGALARLPAELARHKPGIVLIELGANDGLRAQPLKQMRDNLRQMIRLSKQAGARPLLVEMRLPSNYGPEYTTGFQRSYGELAKEEHVPLIPFLLAPIVMDAQWFQNDGIHPTAAAQPKLLDGVWPTLKPLLGQPAL